MAENDLLSLVLTLRPIDEIPAPPSLGRAAHALLLQCIRDMDPELATAVHTGEPPRPFTASSLLGPHREGLSPAHTYVVRLTALNRAVTQALERAAADGRLQPGEQVRLGEAVLLVEGASLDPGEQAWAGASNYQALSAPWLLAKSKPLKRIRLRFASPTTFRSGDLNQPFPLPSLVYGSLLNRWNAFSSVGLPGEIRRYAEECMAVSRYQLSSRRVPLKNHSLRMGAVGWMELVSVNPDPYWLSMIHLLTDFALYAGVGAATTMGMGQVRREERPSGRSSRGGNHRRKKTGRAEWSPDEKEGVKS